MAIAIAGALALCLCFAGWFALVRARLELATEFVPVTAFSLIICLLFCAGMVNLLEPAALGVLLFGIGCLAFYCVRLWRKKCLWRAAKGWVLPGTVFAAAVFAFYLVWLRGASLTNVDDYVHWAAMVKEMLMAGRLPNFLTRLITHQNYPPASALFVWFVTKRVGFGDSRMLLAQLLATLSCLLCLFAFARRHKGALPPVFCALLCCCLLGGMGGLRQDTLAVDTLLPLFALAGTLLIWRYRHNVTKAAQASLPVLCVTLLTKNSGILFVGLNGALLLALAVRERRGRLANPCAGARPTPCPRRRRGWVAAALTAPFWMLLLWNSHVDMVYSDAANSRHAMRMDTLEWFLEHRDGDAFAQISATFVRVGLSFKNRSLLALLVMAAGLLLLAALLYKTHRRTAKHMLLFTLCMAGVYTLYMAGLLGTYLFSMWYEDTGALPAYDRYCSSITIYLLGLCTPVLMHAFGLLGRGAPRAVGAAALACFTAALLVLGNAANALSVRRYQNNRALQLANDQAQVVRNYGYEPNELEYSYIVYLGAAERGLDTNLFQQMCGYALMSRNLLVVEADDDLAGVAEALDDYYFLLILDADARIEELMAQYGVSGKPEPFYLVEKLTNN